jgi:hypothetical protein
MPCQAFPEQNASEEGIMLRLSVVALVAVTLSSSAFAACAPNDTFCQNMQNADQVYQRQQAEQQRQQQQRYNDQNGTSQYSGPKAYSSGASGSPVVGYQKSIK